MNFQFLGGNRELLQGNLAIFFLVYLDCVCWWVRNMYAQGQAIGTHSHGGQKGLRVLFHSKQNLPTSIL